MTIYEAAGSAGGRCRSYVDRDIGTTIDNGNHLLLSGNASALTYLTEIGAADSLGGPSRPQFAFVDLTTNQRWMVRLSSGAIPWWVMSRSRRVPGTRMIDYLRLLPLRGLRDDRSVAQAVPPGPLYDRLLAPLAIAALNTPPGEGLARLLGAVLNETLFRRGADCIPRFPKTSLAASLIDPALTTLRSRGAEIRFNNRIQALETENRRVTQLRTGGGPVDLTPADSVVLATPPWIAADLLAGLTTPNEYQAILNIHFRAEADAGPTGFIGLIGGTAEWVFAKAAHVSVTISAANRLVDEPAEALAEAVWPEVCIAMGLSGPMPPYRVVKEKRATFAATAEQDRRRPGPRMGLSNLALAGDWTATGLPATIEGAIRSGRKAAALLLN